VHGCFRDLSLFYFIARNTGEIVTTQTHVNLERTSNLRYDLFACFIRENKRHCAVVFTSPFGGNRTHCCMTTTFRDTTGDTTFCRHLHLLTLRQPNGKIET